MRKFNLTIEVDPTKVKRGHMPHRSGVGKHGDRRTKRLRTRTNQKREALAQEG